MAAEGAPLSVAVKLDLMLQVARGLEALKDARVLWRDLKAKNLLVADVWRGRAGEVTKVSVKFTDWGTAVKMLQDGRGREPPAHDAARPGHRGYIAPDTRGPMYDYQADMWAYSCGRRACASPWRAWWTASWRRRWRVCGWRRRPTPPPGTRRRWRRCCWRSRRPGRWNRSATRCSSSSRPLRPGWAQLRWTPEEAAEELEQFPRRPRALALAPGTRDEKSLIR